jgi:hypothetical protein
MSFKYLLVKNVRGTIHLGVSKQALSEFSPEVLSFWIISTLALYRREHVPAELDQDAAAFLAKHEKPALLELDKLSPAASLLMESVLLACEMPAHSDLDKNLTLISATYGHAQVLSSTPIPDYKIRYTLRKHRDTTSVKLMTIKGDVMSELGLEATSLVLMALREAAGRDLGLKVSICNRHEIFGSELHVQRVAPVFVNHHDFLMKMLVVDHIEKKLTLPFVKDNVGTLKLISDYLKSISSSA